MSLKTKYDFDIFSAMRFKVHSTNYGPIRQTLRKFACIYKQSETCGLKGDSQVLK